MSFTSMVKNEITKNESLRSESIAELSAIMRNNSSYENKNIKVSTENAALARRIYSLLKNLYDIQIKITVRSNFNFKKNMIYILEISDKVESVINDLCLNENIPKDYIFDNQEEKSSYLKGCFLAKGSINDPKSSRYHLEFLVDTKEYALFLKNILNEYYLNSRVLRRSKGYMVYIKEAEKIGDFLRIIKAYNAVLYYEDIRIYRDHKNMTNRLNNCEQANVNKIIETATKQVDDINLIIEKSTLDLLDDKTKEACLYRLKYQESSLLELSNIMTHETGEVVTKSGLNHRFRRVRELADKMRK